VGGWEEWQTGRRAAGSGISRGKSLAERDVASSGPFGPPATPATAPRRARRWHRRASGWADDRFRHQRPLCSPHSSLRTLPHACRAFHVASSSGCPPAAGGDRECLSFQRRAGGQSASRRYAGLRRDRPRPLRHHRRAVPGNPRLCRLLAVGAGAPVGGNGVRLRL
jgi:hypothetical protein